MKIERIEYSCYVIIHVGDKNPAYCSLKCKYDCRKTAILTTRNRYYLTAKDLKPLKKKCDKYRGVRKANDYHGYMRLAQCLREFGVGEKVKFRKICRYKIWDGIEINLPINSEVLCVLKFNVYLNMWIKINPKETIFETRKFNIRMSNRDYEELGEQKYIGSALGVNGSDTAGHVFEEIK